jgi:hypothetical protein
VAPVAVPVAMKVTGVPIQTVGASGSKAIVGVLPVIVCTPEILLVSVPQYPFTTL